MIWYTALKVLERIVENIDIDENADPLLSVFAILAAVGAYRMLTGWREEWDRRTAIGKVGFAVSAPLRFVTGILMATAFLVYALVIAVFLIPEMLFAILDELNGWYRGKAIREDSREST